MELNAGAMKLRGLRAIWQVLIVLVMIGIGIGGFLLLSNGRSAGAPGDGAGKTDKTNVRPGVFKPTEAQWAALEVYTVEKRPFRLEVVTEGKIAINEDTSTPVFSPYSGIVKRLAVKPGDAIKPGQLLFSIEATDMVQAQNDFITANATLDTVRSTLNLAETIEKRQRNLFESKATALKDWQQAQADLVTAQSNVRAGEIALEAVRNRLRILKKTEDEIAEFQKSGTISPDTPIYSPIGGTIVQRKVGPGQFITSGASDPAGNAAFVVGDLSQVWLVISVRETDTEYVRIGQSIEFKLIAYANRTFSGKIDYVAEAIDSTTRRLWARATIDNVERLLKPEMFARVTILASVEEAYPAVPREAILYEGDAARVWVANGDKSLELRQIRTGMLNGNLVQVLEGLQPSERVVTKGALFIDRAAAGDQG
jgi:cobalt-zinc-cadmium efflux system membrane fusion protein